MSTKPSAVIFSRLKLLQNKLRFLRSRETLKPLLYQASLKHMIDNIGATNKRFAEVAVIGPEPAYFLENCPANVEPLNIFVCDISGAAIVEARRQIDGSPIVMRRFSKAKIYYVVVDEQLWPFKEAQLDLIVSNMHLHWTNDLHVSFSRLLESMRLEGSLHGAMLGEDSLMELRIAFTLAESERCGGVSQHVSPMISITELGNLLNRCSFSMPSVFSSKSLLLFDSCLDLMQLLSEIGGSNAMVHTRQGVFKDNLNATIAIYDSLFRHEDRVYSTLQTMYFNCWKEAKVEQSWAQKQKLKAASIKDMEKEIKELAIEFKGKIRSGQIVGDKVIPNE